MISHVNRIRFAGISTKTKLKEKILYINDIEKVLDDPDSLSEILREWVGDVSPDVSRGTDGRVRMRYVGGYLCSVDDFPDRCMRLRKIYLHYHHKKSDPGPIAYHIIISWEENARVSNEEVYKLGCLILKGLGNYPGIIGAHITPEVDETGVLRGVCKHCHILVCAYPDCFDGPPKKLIPGRGNIYIRTIADQIGIAFKQKILVRPDNGRTHGYYLATDDEAWVRQLRKTVDECATEAKEWDDFQGRLRERGCDVKRCGAVLQYSKGTYPPIVDKRLGREYTEWGLQKKWDPVGAVLDDPQLLEALEAVHGKLYAKIPLGGWEFTENFYTYPLGENTLNFAPEVLESYFERDEDYHILVGNPQMEYIVRGHQILDYLGINAADSTENSLTAMRRRAWEIERIRRQAERTCERELWMRSEMSRCIVAKDCYAPYMRRHNVPGGETPILSLNPDGTHKSLAEEFLLRLCASVLPEFDPSPYCFVFKRETEEDRLRSMKLSAASEAWCIAVSEYDVRSQAEFEDAARAAKKFYEAAAKDAAMVKLNLTSKKAVYEDMEECRLAAKAYKECLISGETCELTDEERERVVKRFEEAQEKLERYMITNWHECEMICKEYHYMKELLPKLEQLAAARFEQAKKLEYGLWYERAKRMEIAHSLDHDNKQQEEPSRSKCSLTEQILRANSRVKKSEHSHTLERDIEK